ncbi:MAG: FtsX-like permease family protein [Lachnospiraceae bacterium]|nr:FtsX-like permease family protein [Lachnospiraceae bacterium]
MVKVANKRCIRELSINSLRASKSRNIVASCAIALTTILFTVLFTVLLSLNHSLQESNFRQAGSRAHGSFKSLTKEQADELKGDSRIKEYGIRHLLGMAVGEAFAKTSVEVSYCDENHASWTFLTPIEGGLPKEGTNEAATDTEVLHLLGVVPKVGAEFTLPMEVGGVQTEQTFTLSGWWESDAVAPAHHVLVPDSTVNEMLNRVGVAGTDETGVCGSLTLDVMLKNAMHIEDDLVEILEKHGYSPEGMRIGVNWGYTGATLFNRMEPGAVIAMAVILLLMMGTGYLIIYNVFQISVVGEIRFFGLLKTIGTTQKQIQCIIRNQALLLSGAGIPAGALLGWLLGVKLTPVILGKMNVATVNAVFHPFIFLFAAVFSLITVLISCRRPGRVAAAVYPVEALRYTEGSKKGQSGTKRKGSGSLLSMAKDNLARSKSKTVITIVSMALSVVLLNLTVVFTGGFDMDKYVSNFFNADFVVADEAYFQFKHFCEEQTVSRNVVDRISAQNGVEEVAKVFATKNGEAHAYMTEELFVKVESVWNPPETIEMLLESVPRSDDGRVKWQAQVLGMEEGALKYAETIEGDMTKLNDPDGKYIAVVEANLRWAEPGDTVTLDYDGRVYEYEVAAVVSVPYSLGYRYSGGNYFLLPAEILCEHSEREDILCAAFEVEDAEEEAMEQFLRHYIEKQETEYDYESKFTIREEFEETRRMFFLVGVVLSFVVGMIGVLNFFNSILTGILTRRREFAMLQAIGMTGRQLKRMLVYEGLMYAVGAVGCAVFVSLLSAPVMKIALEGILWFFTYRLTVLPLVVVLPIFVLLGVAVPIGMYRIVAKQTVVERLRECEN